MIHGIVRGFSSMMLIGALVAIGAMAPTACTKAQDVAIVTDISKYGAGACVAVEALGGAAIPLIATVCELTEDVVVAVLDGLGTAGDDAGLGALVLAAQVRTLPAYEQAEKRKAARR